MSSLLVQLCFEQECISVTVLANLIGLEPCNFGSNGLTCSGNGVSDVYGSHSNYRNSQKII